jgi:hypothetical protein
MSLRAQRAVEARGVLPTTAVAKAPDHPYYLLENLMDGRPTHLGLAVLETLSVPSFFWRDSSPPCTTRYCLPSGFTILGCCFTRLYLFISRSLSTS